MNRFLRCLFLIGSSWFVSCSGVFAEEQSANIRLNTVGYFPRAPKIASLAEHSSEFEVVRVSDGAIVFKGQVKGPQYNPDTEEDLYLADFSSVETPGTYKLVVDRVGESPPFKISQNIYLEPFRLATRGFYLWRCGSEVSSAHNGHTYSHAACHLAPASFEFSENEHPARQSLYGWHDAGDYNKYVVNGAMSLGVLLSAWEDFGPDVKSVALDLPDSESPLPEYLQELKWELDWLFSMQAENGSVYCKLSTKDFCGMIPPEKEEFQQYFTPWSSDSVADFVAVMAQAARVYKPYDEALSARCLVAAEKSYQFLVAHPEQHVSEASEFKTGRYQSKDWDERLWAAAELWEATGREDVLADLEYRLEKMRGAVDFNWDWHKVRNLAVLRYVFSQRDSQNTNLVEKLKEEVIRTAERIVSATDEHGYGRPLGDRYFWGCNGSVARQAVVLNAAYRLTLDHKYRRVAIDALNHLLGRNCYGRSYVTGLGHKPPMHIHDRRSASDGIDEPWPGYLVSGPNPKSTDWKDVQEDYRTNEVAINWNAALVYAMAMFLEDQPLTSLKSSESEEKNFNADWRFRKGDPEDAAARNFDDSQWQEVRLPHDWAISGPFDPKLEGSTGKRPWRGVGWYRKEFFVEAGENDRVYLDFDGVMAFPQVYINGQLAGNWDYGYTPFLIDITEYLKPNEKNLLAVRVDTTKHYSRWYPGAGIYRKVRLHVTRPVHFSHWGTHVTTPEISDQLASVHVETSIQNHLSSPTTATLVCSVLSPDGNVVEEKRKDLELQRGANNAGSDFKVANPRCWDINSPELYKLRCLLEVDGEICSEQEIPFGIRSFKFTADDGFHLNGRRVQLNGVNLHHDHGPLGAAFNRRAMQRQLEIMQEMGVNAIRTSHNAAARELLDLCDEMGLLVWDECFDKWDQTAGRVNGQPPFEEYGERHLRNFVLRDRNHPCVVVWSIGNEIPNQPNREGKSHDRVKLYREIVRKYDTTRPVGIGCFIPETSHTDILEPLDLTGWNYLRRYGIHRKKYPDCPLVYSESASTLSTRGYYELPHPQFKSDFSSTHQVDSYDLNSASWSDIPDSEFDLMRKDSFVAGEFVWTGFDYLGEPTPFAEVARSSYFGIVDLCGIPKDRYYLYRSHWRPEETTLHMLPHWNWHDRLGENVPVFVYTNADSAELFLNGKSQGMRTKRQLPEMSENLARSEGATCSSNHEASSASLACDGDGTTSWCTSHQQEGQWWQVDFGSVQVVKFLSIEFEKEAKKYGYEILTSNDMEHWESIVSKSTSNKPRWGGPCRSFHKVDCETRFIRIIFNQFKGDVGASLREFGAYAEVVESSYYHPTYDYRLRWNDVVYEPGELEVVAYQDDQIIGRKTIRTAGKPYALRLTPDRTLLDGNGEDLCYVLIEAVDGDGNLCPLADNSVKFEIEGNAKIAGVGNGNPLSLAPFQADNVCLFHGKAMLIVNALGSGEINIRASSAGLESKNVTCLAQ